MRIQWTTKSVTSLLLITMLSTGGVLGSVRQETKSDHDSHRVLRPATAGGSTHQPDATTRVRIREAYDKLPLSFEANQGQTDSQVKFLSRGSGYTLFLTSTEAVLSFTKPGPPAKSEEQAPGDGMQKVERTVLRMQLVGANSDPQIRGVDERPARVSYFVGNDPRTWHAQVATYAKVSYREIYPGVDLVYYGNQRQLEYDFVVAPGADPKAIRLGFQGADKLAIDPQGNLILETPSGEVIQNAPVIYQETDGGKQTVPGRYVLRGQHQVSFQVAAYDTSRPLIIDPTVLGYSTYLGGGSNDIGRAIFVDPWGYAYVTGETTSTDFPQRQNTYTAAPPSVLRPTTDAFVSVFQPTGFLMQSIYFGGPGDDSGKGIAVDSNGRAYIAGSTTSPVLPNAVPPTPGGQNAFVATFGPIGSFSVASTFLGGDDEDWASGIAMDAIGRVYVTGTTYSTNFPRTAGAFQSTMRGFGDAFVARWSLTNSGLALDYSTYLGGSSPDWGNGISVDTSGNAYVTGFTSSSNFPTTVGAFQTAYQRGAEAYVAKLNSTGSALVYSTFLGANGHDEGNGIAVDTNGNAYVTGFTDSRDIVTTPAYDGFPIVNAFQSVPSYCGYEAFVTKLNSTGSGLIYSTYLSGCGDDIGYGVAVDPYGFAYVTGSTGYCDFPQLNPLPSTPPCSSTSSTDVFVAKFGSTGTLVYSTLLVGNSLDEGYGIAVTRDGTAYVIGITGSTNFPTVNAYQPAMSAPWDAFVATVTGGTPNLRVTTVSNPPASVSVGVAFNMTDTTANAGTGLAVASTTSYRLSPDATITAPPAIGPVDLLLQTRSVPALPNGANSSGTTSVKIPATVATGAYYLGACADDQFVVAESSERDNCRATSTTVQVINPAIISDLVIDAVTALATSVAPGGSVGVKDTTANVGNGSTVGVSTTQYRLSTDSNITATDLLLGSRSIPILAAGTTSKDAVTVTIPSTVARGSYFLGACADGGAAIMEGNERNNCRATPITVF